MKRMLDGTRLAGRMLLGLSLLFVFWDVLVRLGVHGTHEIGLMLVFCECVMAGMVLARAPWLHRGWCYPLVLFFPLVLMLCILRGWEPMNGSLTSLQRGLFVFVDLGIAWLLLDEKEIKGFLLLFLSLWTALYAALASCALWVSAHGEVLYNLTGSAFLGVDPESGRLSMFAYCTICAEELCAAIIMAILGAVMCRRWPGRVLFLLPLVPLALALALTDAKTSIVCTGGGLGLILVCAIDRRFPLGKKLVRWLIAAIALMAVVVVTYVTVTGLVDVYNHQAANLVQGRTPLITSALAEETEEAVKTATVAVHRAEGNTLSLLLTGRDTAWIAAMYAFKNHPGLLVLGGTIPHWQEIVQPYNWFPLEHVHSMPLQILGELGIGGLLLYLWFAIAFIRAAWRLFFSTKAAMWQRILPIPTVCLLVAELFECITRLCYGHPTSALFMIFAGATLAMERLVNGKE